MKINMTVRAKNPWFWISLVGVILTAMGISPEMFTSWQAVWDAIVQLVSNPYMLGTVIIAVLGVFIDPTTKGINDSERAMSYTKPN
jgi:phi LC3 family holin